MLTSRRTSQNPIALTIGEPICQVGASAGQHLAVQIALEIMDVNREETGQRTEIESVDQT